MEREYRGMTTNEVIEQIKAGHISFADIADYLNDRTDAERRNFCFRMFCSIPMEPITISMESFRDYDAIPYSKKHKPSYHEVKSTGLTPQQESEKDRLLNAIGFIESKYGIDLFGEYQDKHTIKPTNDVQNEPQQAALKDLLPEKLKADEAVKVFQNAIDAQLITNSPEGLKWNDTKQLLAYFATKVSDKFCLTTRLDKDGNKTTDWKTFETLFKQKGLKGAKQNWMRLNTKFEPTKFEKVDALF
ncbi:MAG: hypothetical protein J6A02_00560 [Prevotella sp.]|nr:hypothetical protein [Prevotella sp.]